MCDQDHFDDDKQAFEAAGLVTRRQFGVLLGAGVAMLLPKVANAVAVTEADVMITTPDGMCDAYFVHPATGTAPGVLIWPDIFGLRPAFRQMGKRLAESGYSVVVINPFYRTKKAPTADNGAATPIAQVSPLAQTLNETTHMTRREGVHRMAGSTAIGREEPEDGHAGLLHGRSDGVPHGGSGPDRIGAVAILPRRRPGHRRSRTARISRRRRAKRSSSSRSPRTTTSARRPTRTR